MKRNKYNHPLCSKCEKKTVYSHGLCYQCYQKSKKKTKKDLLGTLRLPTPPPGHSHGDKKKYDRKSSKKDTKRVIMEET